MEAKGLNKKTLIAKAVKEFKNFTLYEIYDGDKFLYRTTYSGGNYERKNITIFKR